MYRPILFIFLFLPGMVNAELEQTIKGIIDVRLTQSETSTSYLEGGYGKFQFSDDAQFSFAHLGLSYSVAFDELYSLHIIASGYAQNESTDLGISEGYIQYKGLPDDDGWRHRLRYGFLYPDVSMVNFATAWTSPYTLSFDAINSWLAEEVRHEGLEYQWTRLGRMHNQSFDTSVSLAIYNANDPVGAMLAWHGWVSSSYQSLRHQELPLPVINARFVPEASDAFLELDGKYGYAATINIKGHSGARLKLGYYDNQADPKVVKNSQWGWLTTFSHLGVQWPINEEVRLIAQYLTGNTLMQTPSGSLDLVNNDYASYYLMLVKQSGNEQYTIRGEEFEVQDLDVISSDNNNETGKSFTLGYRYQWRANLFTHLEYQWINSDRASRSVINQANDFTEQQFTIALRYYF